MALSEEKIFEIQERLKGLSPEEQQKKLNEILRELSPEELQDITQQNCLFCEISNKKIDAKTVYEDGIVMAVLDINPANKGHILIFPKKHHQFLFQVSDTETEHLFKIINKLSLAIINGLNAEGNNIFIANGQIAGQNSPHIVIHLIPRFKDDKIDFKWIPKKINEEEMLSIANLIRVNLDTAKQVKVNKQKSLDYDEEERVA
ncbi:HIT family protein [Candidatus Woesearchaeota archaeon]|nr:HIT family protein [Candidatus Woesearchaeota archaeon]